MPNKYTILGTGTSTGVPTIGCECPVCLSEDSKDKRLRCSLLIKSKSGTTVVVDTSSDFRQQMLLHKVKNLDAVIFTHHHFDHIGGFDDIRAFNFAMSKPLPIFATDVTLNHLKRVYNYAFSPPEQIGGGIPLIEINEITESNILIDDISINVIPMFHGMMEVLGFRVDDFAYCTDTNFIPETSLKLLSNLEVLIIDGLRFTPHPTHYCLSETLEIIEKLKPKKAYITHISHDIKHSITEKLLPENVYLAYDGIEFDI